MHSPRITLLWLMLTMLVGLPIAAQEGTALFDRRGVIDAVQLGQQRLVIYDVDYRFPSSTPVYRYTPRRDADEAEVRVDQGRLRPGMLVGYAVQGRDAHGREVLTGVLILPRRGRR